MGEHQVQMRPSTALLHEDEDPIKNKNKKSY
jgi:hypothetical protein